VERRNSKTSGGQPPVKNSYEAGFLCPAGSSVCPRIYAQRLFRSLPLVRVSNCWTPLLRNNVVQLLLILTSGVYIMTFSNNATIASNNTYKSYSKMSLKELWAERTKLLEICSIEDDDDVANGLCGLYCAIDKMIASRAVKSNEDAIVKLNLVKNAYLGLELNVDSNDIAFNCMNEIGSFLQG
jgi:hypothetical protein